MKMWRSNFDPVLKLYYDREVTWDEVNRKSRIPKGDASTAAKRMKEAFGIKRRTPRFKPTPLLKHRQELGFVNDAWNPPGGVVPDWRSRRSSELLHILRQSSIIRWYLHAKRRSSFPSAFEVTEL